MSDVDMLADDFRPMAAGEPVVIAGLAGRARRYVLHLPDGVERPALGIAISRRCDVVVAASQGAGAGSAVARLAIAGLIERADVRDWMFSLLGKD